MGNNLVVAFNTFRQRLPRGGELPVAEFERRHRWLLALLLSSAVALPLYGFARGYPLSHSLVEGALPLVFALLAAVPRALSGRVRSVSAALGLSTSAAVAVHLSGGLTEAHFAFFVIVLLLTLYEDWLIYGIAVGFVLVHHGVMGMVDPSGVFGNPDQFAHPWLWAGIHAAFIGGASLGAVLTWRLNEDVRARMGEVQGELERAAMTDSLTGLANRRALVADLDDVLVEAQSGQIEALLVLADLNGFKLYNDTFGHMAGDALLQQLGRKLIVSTAAIGKAYRLGGDEFCVLVLGGDENRAAVQAAVADALTETGEGFTVTSSTGLALIPHDAATASQTLRVADQRMYAQKSAGRTSAGAQSKNALLLTLAERHPDLCRHLADVTKRAADLARSMGLSDEAIEQVRHAAELHDIGKIGIPDALLDKTGPLSDTEWEFMKRHTIIGERILAGIPSLANAAAIVRSSHEHWDGTGYPDQLDGDQILLGARMIHVANAFSAMTEERCYAPALSAEDARAELERCAGTQFDPKVVKTFLGALEQREQESSEPGVTWRVPALT